MSSTGSGPTRPVLLRELTLLDATMINIGSMIGSGIFLVPAMIAVLVDSSLLVLAVWIVAGIVSLFGAISIAELGAMMPEAGGQYVFLSRTFGRVWGRPGVHSKVGLGHAPHIQDLFADDKVFAFAPVELRCDL